MSRLTEALDAALDAVRALYMAGLAERGGGFDGTLAPTDDLQPVEYAPAPEPAPPAPPLPWEATPPVLEAAPAPVLEAAPAPVLEAAPAPVPVLDPAPVLEPPPAPPPPPATPPWYAEALALGWTPPRPG